MNIHGLDVAIIVLYFAGLTAVGLWCARRQESRAEYHLGGGKIHWLLAGGSVLVTLLSTLTFLAGPGEMVRYGIAYFAGALALPFCAPLINRWLVPLYRSMPATSIYEFLEVRFGRSVRTLAALVFVLRSLLWVGLIVYSCTMAAVEVTGFNFTHTLLLTGVVTVFYATIGGFKTVVWTDNIQLVILLAGAVAVPVYIWYAMGAGPGAWWGTFSEAGRAKIEIFSFDPTVRITLVGMALMHFFWTLCANASDQAAAQRYLSTETEGDAKKSVWVFASMNILFTALLMLCGLALFAFYARQSGLPVQEFQANVAPRADKLMPMFIARELPVGLSGLLLAALLSAAMSSISSGVNSISSVVTTDLWPSTAEGSLVWDKSVAAVAGALGIASALLMSWSVQATGWNLYETTSRVNNLFVGPMAVFFLTAVLIPGATKRGVLAGFFAGTLAAIGISFGTALGMAKPISFTWLVPGSCLAGMAVAWLLGKRA